ncbi:MAG: GNAT family N-acetyltransferase [Pseudomonadota bacterium]
MITIELCDKNPIKSLFFEFPQLISIWPNHLSLLAQDATQQWEANSDENGEIYKIIDHHLGYHVVGITGWWPISDTDAGLRWHGVIQAARRNGISKTALQLLSERLQNNYDFLHEVAYTPNAAHYFEKNGFFRSLDIEKNKKIITSAEGGEIVLTKPLLKI